MKVLKENNPTTVGKCNLCGSTLEISISDFNITFLIIFMLNVLYVIKNCILQITN